MAWQTYYLFSLCITFGTVSGFSSLKRPSSMDFDFSSARGWETHYQENFCQEEYDEWHATIDFGTIVRYCSPPIRMEETVEEEASLANVAAPIAIKTIINNNDTKTDILMVGCGTSRLPEAFDPSIYQLTLLDAAPTCIETLEQRYADRNFTYIVGDAVRMHGNTTGMYDCVVDKGLMDALLCGEGWNLWVAQLLDSVANVLRVGTGTYVLVSYRLPSSTMAFLEKRSAGKLLWEFSVEGSNPRVMISIARRLQDFRANNETIQAGEEVASF